MRADVAIGPSLSFEEIPGFIVVVEVPYQFVEVHRLRYDYSFTNPWVRQVHNAELGRPVGQRNPPLYFRTACTSSRPFPVLQFNCSDATTC